MNELQYREFLESQDTLCVLDGDKKLFTSKEDSLFPLLEYIDRFSHGHPQVTILDKTVGNAAALLSIKAGAREVYSPLGSQSAVDTMKRYKRRYHFTRIVPFILDRRGKGMCPMEKLSLSENMSPDLFYETAKQYCYKAN